MIVLLIALTLGGCDDVALKTLLESLVAGETTDTDSVVQAPSRVFTSYWYLYTGENYEM